MKGVNVIWQCPKCSRITCISNNETQNVKRADGHHDHMKRCKPGFFIKRTKTHLSLTGYENKNMPFWLWKF